MSRERFSNGPGRFPGTRSKMAHANLIRSHPHTVMFVDTVESDKLSAFEEWSRAIHEEAEQFDGFADVTVIQFEDDSATRFLTLLRFDNRDNLRNWIQSECSQEWVSQLSGILQVPEIAADGAGTNLWFKFQPMAQRKPQFWKEVVVGTAVVYPMILILNFLLDPLIGGLPAYAAIFVVVVALSAMLACPIMPLVNSRLHPWLFKGAARSGGIDRLELQDTRNLMAGNE